MNATQQAIHQAQQLIVKLDQIKRSSGAYFLSELNDWIEHDVPEIAELLHEAFQSASDEFPDQQQILEAEHHHQIEWGAAS